MSAVALREELQRHDMALVADDPHEYQWQCEFVHPYVCINRFRADTCQSFCSLEHFQKAHYQRVTVVCR